MEVNIHEAKTHLSRLLEKVALGEEVIIAKAGRPIAKLVPVPVAPHDRVLGTAKGEFTMSDDFNAPLPPAIKRSVYKRTFCSLPVRSSGQYCRLRAARAD